MAIEYFPRRPIDRPSTRIQTDTSELTGSASDSEKTIMLIGSAQGGKPDTVYKVRNIIQAKEIFRGGELLDALEMAWNPSATSMGAGNILAMRVEDAEPATKKLEGVEFRTKLFGKEANGVQFKIETAEIGNQSVRVLEVLFDEDGYRRVYRNIGNIMRIEKDDNSAPESIEVEVKDDKLTITVTESEGVEVNREYELGKGKYRNANVLVNDINSIKGVRATMPTGGNKNINTRGLDDIKETISGEDDEIMVTGLLADIYNQLQYDDYLEVVIDENKIDPELSNEETLVIIGGTEINDTNGLVTMEGGSSGTIPETWASKFLELANEGGYYLVPLTDKESIHAEATAFVNDRTNNGEPMRAIVGAGFNESPAQLLGRAGVLRDPRAMLVGFSGKNNLDDGRVVEVPAYMYASQVAGIASGLPIGEAITFKDIRLTDLAEIYDSDQMDDLNSGGVVMAEFVRNRQNTNFRLVDDVTTYNDPTDPVRNQMGVGEGSDFLISELKIMLDDNFIGTSVVNMSASLIKNAVQSFLDQKRRDNEIQDYNPEDVQVVINGEVANITLVIFPIRSLKRIEVSMVYRQQILEA